MSFLFFFRPHTLHVPGRLLFLSSSHEQMYMDVIVLNPAHNNDYPRDYYSGGPQMLLQSYKSMGYSEDCFPNLLPEEEIKRGRLKGPLRCTSTQPQRRRDDDDDDELTVSNSGHDDRRNDRTADVTPTTTTTIFIMTFNSTHAY
jgi:hypothetical protein